MSVSNLGEAGDGELLRLYVENRSEQVRSDAMSALVARHAPMVYAAARRQRCDASLADDVTQAVFIVLMRKAKSIRRPEMLPGWLIRVAHYCASNARRQEQRRARHESGAAVMKQAESEFRSSAGGVAFADAGHGSFSREAEEAGWLPLLDAAIANLSETDRTIVTTVYLESQPVEGVAVRLGMNQAAVRQRLSRAIRKLRKSFKRSGVEIAPQTLAIGLQHLPPVSIPNVTARVVDGIARAGVRPNSIARAAAKQLRVRAVKVGIARTLSAVAVVLATGAIVLALFHRESGLFASLPPISAPRMTYPNWPVVYASDFEHGGTGWSLANIDHTPKNHTPFLGQFATEESTSLTLRDLPAHELVHVEADLYIINTWDGVARIEISNYLAGPDFFSLSIDDRPALIRSTFTATPESSAFTYPCRLQTFPNVIPGFANIAGTGADSGQKLGYIYTFGPGASVAMDSVYHLDFTVPHNAGSISLTAAGSGLDGVEDEGWGLANVHVRLMQAAEVPTPTAQQMQSEWQAVIGPDAIASRKAFNQLIASDESTIAFLQNLADPPGFNIADVQARLGQLSSNDAFDAERDLVAMGPGVEALLTANPQLASSVPAKSLKAIFKAIELRPIEGTSARAAAAKARLLGITGTPGARGVLLDWIDHAPAWKPDLVRQFESVYRLPADKSLVYVPHPDPAARTDYLRQRGDVLRHAPTKYPTLFDARRHPRARRYSSPSLTNRLACIRR